MNDQKNQLKALRAGFWLKKYWGEYILKPNVYADIKAKTTDTPLKTVKNKKFADIFYSEK